MAAILEVGKKAAEEKVVLRSRDDFRGVLIWFRYRWYGGGTGTGASSCYCFYSERAWCTDCWCCDQTIWFEDISRAQQAEMGISN